MIRLHMNKENQTLARLYCHLCFSQMEEELPAGFEEVSCNVREDQEGLRSHVCISVATREDVRILTPKLMPMSKHTPKASIVCLTMSPDYRLEYLKLRAKLDL